MSTQPRYTLKITTNFTLILRGKFLNLTLLAILPLLCSRININLSPPITRTPILIIPTAPPTATATPRPPATPAPPPTAAVPFPVMTVSSQVVCPVPNLAPDQHISANGSLTETQWVASGPMACRIERDSCPYNLLTGLLDPTIVFNQEEGGAFGQEDILMHPAMLAPLSRLSQMVLDEWDGEYHLRVTDAYDSLLEHDLNQPNPNRKYSLHFEGRAIDLTLWPVDRSRYGRLCALAHCAGFNWVHNEITHCHASINAESLCQQCDQ